jgi:hypothetical protein
LICARINNQRRTVWSLGLKTRTGIGASLLLIKLITVESAGFEAGDKGGKIAFSFRGKEKEHWMVALDNHVDAPTFWCPDAKMDAFRQDLRPDG